MTAHQADMTAPFANALSRLRQYKDRLRAVALVLALALFCTGLFLSLRATPDLLVRINLAPLALVFFVTIPITIMASAIDFIFLARLSGVRIGLLPAVEVTLYTRAANMLPIPGSIAVRMAVLKTHGATFKKSGAVMFLLTAIWGALGFCYSAAWLAGQAPSYLTIAFGLIGGLALCGCAAAVIAMRLDRSFVAGSAAMRGVMIVLEGFSLMLAVKAIGVDAAYHQTAILVVCSFLASIVPAGIGVRETLIAALAPVAGIDPATGFLAATVSRVTTMTFLAMAAAAIFSISPKTKVKQSPIIIKNMRILDE